MTLQSGSTLSQYRIAEKIGEGGMGVVWKASDTSLGRDVAIKVLPDLFARDAERLARFEREARLLATLNHPNIAAIFGLHRDDGIRFLAMELVPGENLADRIARGPVPLEEALAFARQIAEALEAAHESGVIHRDLKPANIRIRPDGVVKVLDFGLAKALLPEQASASSDPSMSPTITSLGTVAGVVLGTAAYMSPEQVRGRQVDRRADIWSFGCVLYEMLAGRRLFGGETVSDTMAAVLREGIDWSRLPAELPSVVRHLLARCLDRDPRTRLRDAGEARIALAAPQAGGLGATASAEGRRAGRTGWMIAAAAALALLAGIALGASLLAPRAPASDPRFAFDIAIPDRLIRRGSIALSPDGSNLALLVRGDDGAAHLWVRPLASLEARELPGTRNAQFPFWSPDGKEIAFFANHQLMRIALDGAAPRPVTAAPNARGGTWNSRGVILFGGTTGPIFRVGDAGGAAAIPVTKVEANVESSHVWPVFLPDGERFLFLADASSDEGHRVYLASLSGGAPRVLKKVVRSSLGFDPIAGVLLSQKGQLVSYQLNAGEGTLTETPALIADAVLPIGITHHTAFTVSAGNLLAYQRGTKVSQLARVDVQSGKREPLAPADSYGDPVISPDGRRIAYELFDSGDISLIWMLDIARGVRTVMSPKRAASDSAAWSADGSAIYFSSNVNGKWEVFRKAVDGAAEPVLVGAPAGTLSADVQDCSNDGRWLLARRTDGDAFDLWLFPLTAANPEWSTWTSSPENEVSGLFSPDSRWIVYASDISGQTEVYVAPVAGGPTQRRWQISSGGGLEPRFSPDGAWIYYRSITDRLMSVPVTVESDRVEAGVPREMLDLPDGSEVRNTFDLFPDGKSLLLLDRGNDQDTAIHVRSGWRPH